MGLSLDVTPLIERLCNAVSKRRERDLTICEDALACIRSEKRNFERIVAKKPYGKDRYEKRARTQYSFEKVADEMKKLTRVKKWRNAATKLEILCKEELLRPPDEREAAEVLKQINELGPLLTEHVERV
jgi:hypothetical protein